MVDASLQPGTSGSPVITVPKTTEMKKGGGFSIGAPKWYFLGVNSGQFGDMQLNAIWYASLIVQLLEKK